MTLKVAIVTPFYNTPVDWLKQCIESVKNQTYSCYHILVSDGNAEDSEDMKYLMKSHQDISIIRLPEPHNDYGDTPRAIGSISAFRKGFDAICWLDADNWFAHNHVESLINLLKKTKAPICTSTRYLCHLNGEVLGKCPEINPNGFIDTNCYLVTKAVKGIVSFWWMMDDNHHVAGDRVVFNTIKKEKVLHRHTAMPTVFYRTAFQVHYDYFGVPHPPGSKPNVKVQND